MNRRVNPATPTTTTLTPLESIWRTAEKAGTGAARDWTLFPHRGQTAANYAPTPFYGCTVVVIVNGHGIVIGHFAEVNPFSQVTCMQDPRSVTDMIDKLESAEAAVDTGTGARAWIVYSDDVPMTSPGYTAIVDNLVQYAEIPASNITPVPYRRGMGGKNTDKLVVQWIPTTDAGGRTTGATLNVYIRSNIPTFTGHYGCDGEPVANAKGKRAALACVLNGVTTTFSSIASIGPSSIPSTTPSSGLSSITNAPTTTTGATITGAPSCSYVYPAPPVVNEAFCSCSGSSFPLTTMTGTILPEESSCAWKTLPTTQMTGVDTDPVFTDIGSCQICTPYAENGADCTPLPSCTPTQPTTSQAPLTTVPISGGSLNRAQATVQAGSSPVHVGTLTSTELYTSVSSALESLCPSVSQTESMTSCSTDSVIIKDIPFVESGVLDKGGELVIKVESSSYNVTSLRDAMIKTAALTAQKSSEHPKNCYTATYEAPIKKRSLGSFSPNLDTARHWLGLEARDGVGVMNGFESNTWCNIASFAGVQYYDPYWREAPNPGSSDYIDASWDFNTGPDGAFSCAFIQDLIEALGVIQPEFGVEAVELGSAIGAACTEAMEHANSDSAD